MNPDPLDQKEKQSPLARTLIKFGILSNERDARAVVVFLSFVVFLISVWFYIDSNKRVEATQETPEVPYPVQAQTQEL